MEICLKFGLNVKKYRLIKKMTQEELAEHTNLHRTYISALERGKRSISLKNIEKIALALGVKEELLFRFDEIKWCYLLSVEI